MPTIKTKWFSSAMPGAPVLSGSIGAMISVLNACLKDGFNLLTVDSLVVAGNVATATKAGHGYIVNQVLLGAGASPAGLNGEIRVFSVTANTFSFPVTGISDQTATGIITFKAAPCGWLSPFTGTNLAVFKSGSSSSSQNSLRVDDTVGQYSSITAADSYTDVNTGVNAWGTQYFRKSNATDATARGWIVIADDKTVYIGVAWSNSGSYDFYNFGDFTSYVAGDAYCFKIQGLVNNAAPGAFGQYSSFCDANINAPNACLCGHSYALIPGAVNLYQGSLCASRAFTYGLNYPWALSGQHGFSVNLNGNSFAAPAPSDNGYHFVPVALYEHSGSGWMVRGAVRGVLHVMEYLPIGSGFSTYTSVENVNGGLVLMARSAGQVYSASGPAYIYPASVVAFSLGDWA